MVIFVPIGSFFFLKRLVSLSFDVFFERLNVLLLKGQTFFCCFFFFVLHWILTRAPAGRSLTVSVETCVNLLNGIQKFVIVEPSTGGVVGGGGGGGAAVVVKPT